MIFKEQDLIDIDELISKFDSALESVAQEVGPEIQLAFDNCIDIFYASYSPNSYDRTYSMYKFSSGNPKSAKHKPLWKKNGKLDYVAGITIGPEHVPGNPYDKRSHSFFSFFSGRAPSSGHGLDVNPEWVFDVSYMKGIHGFNRQNVIGVRNELAKGESAKKGDKKNFRTLWAERTDRWNPGTIPPTSTPPHWKMRKAYKDICKDVWRKMDKAMKSLL